MIRLLITFLSVGLFLVVQLVLYNMWESRNSIGRLSFALLLSNSIDRQAPNVHLQWFPPTQTAVNNLSAVLHDRGVFGLIFDGSQNVTQTPYGVYNWCNMPHVRSSEYIRPPDEYELAYVEVIHRHHKRTPYAANTFPKETDTWDCDDEALLYYGVPLPEGDAAAISWQVYDSPSNPFATQGSNGTCQFPQITAGGLIDSRQHGRDLFGVYHGLLRFLPDELDTSKMAFRVTNNQITSQVAGQVIYGMYPASDHQMTRVFIQPASIDSLEPTYPCPSASEIYSLYGVGSDDERWTRHLTAEKTVKLLARLDKVSNIDRSDPDWHNWFDHYFDNLSARLCHQKKLPCNAKNSTLCVTQADADAVFRRGEYEYSLIYRDTSELFEASVASYGVWMAELAFNLRTAMDGKDKIIYRHNFAHDGSIARLLSILQVNVMFWPGMGSEIVFELYGKDSRWYIRVLWGGQVFTSSNPSLGRIDMLPVEILLAYIDGIVGKDAKKVPHMCA